MIKLTRGERHLRTFMGLNALAHYGVGLAFAIAPAQTLSLMNLASEKIALNLPEVPLQSEKLWLALAFSMMMTVGTLSLIAWYDVRKHKGYVLPLLVSEAASSLCSLFYFIFSERHLAYLVVFSVAGALFLMTLVLLIRASTAFIKAQTAFLRKEPVPPKNTGPARVVALKGEDKFALLDEVLAKAEFFELLEERFKGSGKDRDDFSVVVKPNFMVAYAKEGISVYTDPELVEALIDRIAARGFTNIAVVESQNAFGSYYSNREVLQVATYLGYSTSKNYRIVDLTKETVSYDYGGRLGKHFVGVTWRDADFRISFAKNKTHMLCYYTLTLKNVYGTLPLQDKMKEYHAKREYDWVTIETMKHFSVHFGLIDAIYSSDGQFGLAMDRSPKHTKTVIGGRNLIAVDWVGAKKMGLDPDDHRVGRFLPLAVEAFGKPEVVWIGDKSQYESWQNVSEVLIASWDALEELHAFSEFCFATFTATDKRFTFKWRGWFTFLIRKLISPFMRLLYGYDRLGS